LSVKICTLLKLNRNHREHEPNLFLTTMINEYTTIFNESLINGLGLADEVLGLKPL
jgi:hypothetical protein